MKPQRSTKNIKTLLTFLRFMCLFVACFCFALSCRRASNEKRYDLKGKVVAVEPDKHLVTVSHQDIKDYMPAMTKPFTVHDEVPPQA